MSKYTNRVTTSQDVVVLAVNDTTEEVFTVTFPVFGVVKGIDKNFDKEMEKQFFMRYSGISIVKVKEVKDAEYKRFRMETTQFLMSCEVLDCEDTKEN